METYHRHKGYESGGNLKSHPVRQQHADPVVQRYHNAEIMKATPAPKVVPKVQPKATVQEVKNDFQRMQQQRTTPVPQHTPEYNRPVPTSTMPPGVSVDDEGFLRIDATQIKQKGVRVKFVRMSGRNKKTVGVEILK